MTIKEMAVNNEINKGTNQFTHGDNKVTILKS